MNQDTIVTIASYNDELDANFAKIKLEDAGIKCFLADTNIVNMAWYYSNIVSGIKLNVRASDAKEAHQILSDKQLPDEQQQDENDLKCPSCGSEDVILSGPSKRWAYLSILFFKFPIIVRTKTNRCSTCGHTWTDDKPNEI